MQKFISKDDTAYYKGIAILMIAIHNYFHVRPGFGLENEMAFDLSNFENFLNYFTNIDLDHWLAAIFGYLGHYGVQIFIFLSAYGLAVQYPKNTKSDLQFVVRYLKKVYLLMLFGIAMIVSGSVFIGTGKYDFARVIHDSALLGSTLNTFSRHNIYGMFVGPFWFFGLIIQIYLMFPILYRMITYLGARRVWMAFVGAYVLLYLAYFITLNSDYAVLGSFVGHLPEALLGICFARFRWSEIETKYVIMALGAFLLSQVNEIFFLLSFLSVAIILLWLFQKFQIAIHSNLIRILIFVGNISMIIFISNAPIRNFRLFFAHDSSKLPLFMLTVLAFSYVASKFFEFALLRLKLK